ncbi:MAG TPA: energy-coupling factor ABC transporter permease, partial [Deltaproteobacteria bacterium]|nr:energy-coupling factor ABC transporter permease [Deltaproteobacteria bacterium]HPR03387.1 energy-coupling factor ABC transporter permease [Deltaproteobacteria bacterium]
FACGFVSLTLSIVAVAMTLVLTEKAFLVTARVVLAAHVPVMVIEGLVTAFVVIFLKKVKPEMVGV